MQPCIPFRDLALRRISEFHTIKKREMSLFKDMSPAEKWESAIPMTTAEIGDHIGVDRSTVLRRLRGISPAVQLKRRRLYRPQDVARVFLGDDYADRVFGGAVARSEKDRP